MAFSFPYPPYDPTDKRGFSYETVVKRWPIILTGIIDTLHRACHKLALEQNQLDQDDTAYGVFQKKIGEGTAIIEKVSKLKYEMARDKPLIKISNDGEASIELYNSELMTLEEDKRNTWFTAPWLYAECYLYRLLRSFFNQTDHWKQYDPFHDQKVKTFQQSGKSIFHIATTMHELEASGEELKQDPIKLKALFKEMIQMCLWGNATDLSLLTHLSQDDIHNLQSVGKEARVARQMYILKDDTEPVWEHIRSVKGGQVDFVLDNSGFELFTDLVFADFLVTYTSYISRVVFHPKLIPWFVSDVTPPDFKETFQILSDKTFFPEEVLTDSNVNPDHLKNSIKRWKTYLDEGTFKLSVPIDSPIGGNAKSVAADFWTTARPYWGMKTEAPQTFSSLASSNLVIFKGDLNFRKLTGDIRWPAWTPFKEAIGPLAGSLPLLSLRTNKADVVVGVDENVAKRLDATDGKWRVDGRYALISFLP